MTRIHGISTNKYLNLATKAKTEKFYVLKDIGVIFKRIGYAFTHRGTIITDRKLAEWAVDAYEKTSVSTKDPEEQKRITKIQIACETILKRVKDNRALQDRYDLAYAIRQPAPVDSEDDNESNSSSTGSNGSDADDESFSSSTGGADTDDESLDVRNRTPSKLSRSEKDNEQPHPASAHLDTPTTSQPTVQPNPKTEIDDEASTNNSDTKFNDSDSEEESLDLRKRGSPLSEKDNEQPNSVSSQINTPVTPQSVQSQPKPKIDDEDSSSSNSESEEESDEAKEWPVPTALTDPSKTSIEDEEEIPLKLTRKSREAPQYNSSQPFSDNLREIKQRLKGTDFSGLTQQERFTLINDVFEIGIKSTTTSSTEDALEWNMLKMKLLSDLTLIDAKAFVSEYPEYKREVIQYNVSYMQYLKIKQSAKQSQKEEAEEKDNAVESSVSSETEEKGKDLSVSLELKESLNLDSLTFEQAIVNLEQEVGSSILDAEKVFVKALAIGEVIKRNKTVLEDKEARKRLAETLEVGRALLYSLIGQNSKMSEENINRIEDISDYLIFLEGLVTVEEEVDDFVAPMDMSGEITYPPKTILSVAKTIGGKIVEGAKGAISVVVETVKNITQYNNPEVNRIKASKYEQLLRILQAPLVDRLDAFVGEPNDQEVLEKLQNVFAATKIVDTEKISLKYLGEIRDAFQYTALDNLRAAVTLCEENPNTISQALKDKVFETCYVLYTTNNMEKETKDLLRMLTTYEGAEPYELQKGEDDYYKLFEELRHTSKTINNAPSSYTAFKFDKYFRSGKDHFGFNFSPIGAGNPPQRLEAIVASGRPTTILGMGSPTMQGKWTALTDNAKIDPVFRGVQYYMSSKGEKQLYVSLQDARQKSAERLRTEPTKSLEKEFSSFYTIILSKNTHFYEGDGAPSNRIEFEKELHRQVFECDDRESGCYISSKVRDEIFEKTGVRFEDTSKEMIASISQLFFIDKEELTVEQRKAFQELYYNFIIGYAQTQLGVDYMNFTCKDGIDRGMGALAWFMFMMMIMSDTEKDPKSVETLKSILYTRAYWTRKRNIIKSREERFINDATWLMNQIRDRAGLRDQFKGEVLKFMPEMQQVKIASLA